MNKKLLIIGAGGHGKVCADVAKSMNKWDEIYFLDDRYQEDDNSSKEIIGLVSDFVNYTDSSDYFVAIGNNQNRKIILQKLKARRCTIATLIHSSAIISERVKIGFGVVVMPAVVINADSTVGDGVILNTRCLIEHDNVIGNFSHISPSVSLAGTVKIGECCWIGIGTTIVNNISICSDSIIGAASLVLKDLLEPSTYVGCPARKISNIKRSLHEEKNFNFSKP